MLKGNRDREPPFGIGGRGNIFGRDEGKGRWSIEEG